MFGDQLKWKSAMSVETADLPIAGALSSQGRSLLSSRLVHKRIAKHVQIIDRGEIRSRVCILCCRVLYAFSSLDQTAKKRPFTALNPGDTCVLALNALFNDLLYPAWVETDAETVIGILPGNAYRTLFASEPSIQDLTIRALSSAVFG